MPVAPTLPIGAVDQHVAQTPQAGADSFGAVQASELTQAGQAGVGAGGTMLGEAAMQQNYANRSQIRDSLSQYSEDVNGYLTDTVLQKQGKDAIGQVPTTQAYLKDLQDKYTQGLTNPAQQRMFSQLAPAINTRAVRLQQRHEMQQTQVYHNQTLDGSIVADTNAAIVDPENVNTTAQANSTIQADTAARYPGDPVRATAAAQLATSNLYVGLTNRIAGYDPARAATFLEKNQGSILPSEYEKLNASVQNQVKTAAANHIVSTLDPLDPNAQRTIDSIPDPELKTLTQAQFDTHKSTVDAAASLDAANKDSSIAQGIFQAPEQAAVSLPKNMPAAQQAQLLAAANTRLQARRGGQPIQTDLAVYNNLVNQAANDPDGFLRRPLTPYATQLSDQDGKNIMDLRADIFKNRESDKARSMNGVAQVFAQGIRGVPELSNDDANGKPLKPGPDAEQRNTQINNFRSDFMNRVQTQLPDAKDRTPENTKKILDDMLVQHVTQKGWFSNTTTAQGLVDENPSLDKTTWKGPSGLNLEPVNVSDGRKLFINYGADRKTGTLWDADGASHGTWNAKSQ